MSHVVLINIIIGQLTFTNVKLWGWDGDGDRGCGDVVGMRTVSTGIDGDGVQFLSLCRPLLWCFLYITRQNSNITISVHTVVRWNFFLNDLKSIKKLLRLFLLFGAFRQPWRGKTSYIGICSSLFSYYLLTNDTLSLVDVEEGRNCELF